MKKFLCLFFVLFSCLLLRAQNKVTFIVKETTNIIHDSIYVTGNFNNWDSTFNTVYLMKPYGEREKAITLNLPTGTLRYKFHRGSWFTVEKQFNGMEVRDRDITIRKDTVLHDNVTSWRDQIFIDKWQALSQPIPDTSRLRMLASLADVYAFQLDFYNSDSAFYYAQHALHVVQKMQASNTYKQWFEEGNTAELILLQETVAVLLHSLGNYPKALEIRLENLKLAEKDRDKLNLVFALGNITIDYLSMKDYPSMLNYALQQDSVLAMVDTTDHRYRAARRWTKNNVAVALYNLKRLPGALIYIKQSLKGDSVDYLGYEYAFSSLLLADIYSAMNESDSALSKYRFVIAVTPSWAGHIAARARAGMARVYQKNQRIDSALLFGRQALNYFQNNTMLVQAWGENSLYYIAAVSPLLAELYKANKQLDSAYKYLQISVTAKDSLYDTDKVRQFQTLGFNEANRRQQLEQQSREEKQRYETKIKMYGLIGIITAFIVLAFVLYRNNRQKQQANTVLQSQKQEIEKTLGELKITQKQLIQSEKMASLGELTAGIAHEIQNPLNFVNNFSEVSNELIKEIQDIRRKTQAVGTKSEEDELLKNIEQNLEKINHHGKRADAIVKGMLQHSRSSSGQKELTDINTLCDEYLRLAYHGLRAKDKSFNATFETDFDATLPKLNIVPQDIGRVILNLLNNAFYAVSEKKKTAEGKFEPTVTISTKKDNGSILISVADNGNGIPEKIKDKIFQPFFTTKPTGQGTGLGLSLAYDIVTKGHAGSLTVTSKKDEGAEFILHLPVNV